MNLTTRNRPKAVARGKELADLIRGQDLLFKARNYMGPVLVDDATCSYRWFRLKMTTQPWSRSQSPRVLEWMVSPVYVSEAADKITLRAYDIVGMLIHEASRIKEIEALRAAGAEVNELLRAFNRTWGTSNKDIWHKTR